MSPHDTETEDVRRYLSSWDPEGEPLPDWVADALDDDPELAMQADARYRPWDGRALGLPEPSEPEAEAEPSPVVPLPARTASTRPSWRRLASVGVLLAASAALALWATSDAPTPEPEPEPVAVVAAPVPEPEQPLGADLDIDGATEGLKVPERIAEVLPSEPEEVLGYVGSVPEGVEGGVMGGVVGGVLGGAAGGVAVGAGDTTGEAYGEVILGGVPGEVIGGVIGGEVAHRPLVGKPGGKKVSLKPTRTSSGGSVSTKTKPSDTDDARSGPAQKNSGPIESLTIGVNRAIEREAKKAAEAAAKRIEAEEGSRRAAEEPARREAERAAAERAAAERVAAERAAATEAQGTEEYTDYGSNDFQQTRADPLSTFSIDVDTASYSLARRKLREGWLPPEAAVRVEEFVNAMRYDYERPPDDAPFGVDFQGAPTPFGGGTWLVRVGVQGKRMSAERRPPVHLTFLVDTSGSMQSEDKIGLVKYALTELTGELRDGDTVSIVAYAGSAGLVLEPTSAAHKDRILSAIARLEAGGSTAMGDGIALAYRQADQVRRDGAVNRVILMSDGDANVGQTSHQALVEMIGRYAGRGITLTTAGFGDGNYKDTMMEQLADKGDGNYYYIDRPDQARKVFVDDLTSTLVVIARDVKIQVEWNASAVRAYRLIGYENRDIADEDFRNDAVDAGEIGAGHQVTALYEVVLAEGATADLATVRIRSKPPGRNAPAVERSYPLSRRELRPSFEETDRDLRIAVASAAFAELLRGSPHLREVSFGTVADIARRAIRPEYDSDDQELVALIERAKMLSGRE